MESFEGSYNERLRSVVKKLRPIDDIFFQKFASNKGFCEELVRTVLEDESITILEHTVQCNLKNLTGRSVILDLQCRLGDGTLCNVEVQKSDNENHVRRANYNASMMETCYSLCGSTFDELPNTIVIFITEHDFFGFGKTMYVQNSVLRFDGGSIDMDFGRKIIYLNIESKNNTKIGKYIRQFGESNPENCTSTKLKEIMELYKGNEKGETIMCKELQELLTEERLKSIVNMIKAGFDKDSILKCEYTEEEYNKAVEKMKQL